MNSRSFTLMYFRTLVAFGLCVLSLADPIGTSISSSNSMPRITTLDVKCGRSGMSVHLTFDQPFPGVIYSKGHFYDPECQFVSEKNTGRESFSFLISSDSCGSTGQIAEPTPGKDMYYENTIIIQNDPLIQEVWDEARTLRCTWQHTISKSVESKSYKIQEPEKVTVDFDSRSVNTLMQIQRGKSPFSFPATGYIYAGEESSVVMYLQDSSNKLDANAISCVATSSKNGRPIDLIDRNGCVLEPKMMTGFAKLRNPENVKATLMLYANFKALEVGDQFKMTCQLEICENKCLEPCALGPYSSSKRRKRQINTAEVIEVEGGAIIIAKEVTGIDDNQDKCFISDIIASAVVILVFMSSLLCCISCYLAYKLHLLKSQMVAYTKH